MVDVQLPVSPADPNQQFQKPVVLSEPKKTYLGKTYLIIIFIFIVVLLSISFYYFTSLSTKDNEKLDASDIKSILDIIPDDRYQEYLNSPDLNSDTLRSVDIENFNRKIIDVTLDSNILYITDCKSVPLSIGIKNSDSKLKIVNEGDTARKIYLSFQDSGVINIAPNSEVEISIVFPDDEGIFTYGCDLKNGNSGYFVLRK